MLVTTAGRRAISLWMLGIIVQRFGLMVRVVGVVGGGKRDGWLQRRPNLATKVT